MAAHQPDVAMGPPFLIASAIVGAQEQVRTVRAVSVNLENCMVVRGWRVIAIAPEEGQSIANLDQAGQASRLASWVGSAVPHGLIVRQWANDAANGETIKFKSEHGAPTPSLSFTSVDWTRDSLSSEHGGGRSRVASQPARQIKGTDTSETPANAAVVIFHIKGPSVHAGAELVFLREGSGGSLAVPTDAGPNELKVIGNSIWEKDGRWEAFEVPPGRWRLTSLYSGGEIFELNFCLGSPDFEVKTGELVYAGAYDLSAGVIGPTLSLDPVRQWLGENSEAARRLKPAVYVNGSRGACGGTYIYDFELNGAPYANGYAWGGAVSSPN